MNTEENSPLFYFINKLFFNVYTYLPDERVADFVNKYSNLLYRYYSPHLAVSGDWTIYPIGHEEFIFETIKHTLEFNSHPFISNSFYKGSLEIFNTSLEGNEQTDRLILNLYFRNKKDGQAVIETIEKSLSLFNCIRKEQTISRCLMVEYSSENQDILNGISYKFGKDVIENLYRLTIYPSSYLIHFPNK
jgi:hypothetical protein